MRWPQEKSAGLIEVGRVPSTEPFLWVNDTALYQVSAITVSTDNTPAMWRFKESVGKGLLIQGIYR